MVRISSLVLVFSLILGSSAFAQEAEDDYVIPPLDRSYDGPVYLNDTQDPDVLIVYTNKAIALAPAFGGFPAGTEDALVAKIKDADDWRCGAYAESGMATTCGKTYIQKIPHNETDSLTTELAWLRTDMGIAAIRDSVGADLVAMVYGGLQQCGVGYLFLSFDPSQANYAHSVTHVQCLPSTFAHELGHNTGCTHNPESTSTSGYTDHGFGHRYCGAGGYRTIMSYQCPLGSYVPRVQRYSNPDVILDGKPTGTTAPDCSVFGACRDCADAIDGASAFIAGYRERVGSVTTTLPVTTTTVGVTTTTMPTTTTSSTVTSTSSTTTTIAVCGDGIKQEGEDCDGSFVGRQCKRGCDQVTCKCIGGPGWKRKHGLGDVGWKNSRSIGTSR